LPVFSEILTPASYVPGIQLEQLAVKLAVRPAAGAVASFYVAVPLYHSFKTLI